VEIICFDIVETWHAMSLQGWCVKFFWIRIYEINGWIGFRWM